MLIISKSRRLWFFSPMWWPPEQSPLFQAALSRYWVWHPCSKTIHVDVPPNVMSEFIEDGFLPHPSPAISVSGTFWTRVTLVKLSSYLFQMHFSLVRFVTSSRLSVLLNVEFNWQSKKWKLWFNIVFLILWLLMALFIWGVSGSKNLCHL
jgi:hypothetical protein